MEDQAAAVVVAAVEPVVGITLAPTVTGTDCPKAPDILIDLINTTII